MGGELTVSSTPGVGSVFHVKLFLPEVHADALGKAAPAPAALAARAQRARRGYAGDRRRILVVDNEEPDRELLVQLLEPLGFELRQAASGHDALDLLATGYRPHAIFMDLAMPGIDGWETLRRVRQMHLANVHCAIVSANAFDKALDNDVDIRPEDFIVKPVRHSELLDWLERRLGLQWQHDGEAGAPPAVPAAAEAPLTYPDAAALAALAQVVALGYYRGILNTLDDIERGQPAHGAFVGAMRQLARQFQFDAMGHILEQAPP
jgi:CheY-like chemotaxis protein